MLKTLKDKWPIIALVGISTVSIGLVVAFLKTTTAFQSPDQIAIESQQGAPSSTVLGYANQSAVRRYLPTHGRLRAAATRSGPKGNR